jgi:hypothetical protein
MKNAFRNFLVLGFAAATLGLAANAHAGCTRDQGRQFCTNDALKLCSQFIPDEAKIQACLQKNYAQLSPNCKKCFSSFEEAMGWAE